MTDVSVGNFQRQYIDIGNRIDSLFRSYQQLHDVYSQSFSDIGQKLSKLPQSFSAEVGKARTLLESCKGTVDRKQGEISSQLYEQGLVLLVGSAESLLRESFRVLLKNNLDKVDKIKNVQFTFEEIRGITGSSDEFPDLVLQKLEDEKNPSEKLNFQNVRQMAGIFKGYFGIDFDESVDFQNLHKYWQIRHLVIHNRGLVDQKFLHNLSAAKIDVSIYKIGDTVGLAKKDYDDCKRMLSALFENLDQKISKMKLKVE
jgi:hypothetical protein